MVFIRLSFVGDYVGTNLIDGHRSVRFRLFVEQMVITSVPT